MKRNRQHKLLAEMTSLTAGAVKTTPAAMAFFAWSIFAVSPALATIDNDVTVTGTFGAASVIDTDSAAVDVEDPTGAIAVEKSGILNDDNGITGQNAGDTISWSITVRNDSSVTIDAITVTDTLGTPVCPTSGDETIATLAPGASEVCTFSYSVTQADFDTNGGGDGDIDNSATAEGTSRGGVGTVSATGTAEVPITQISGVEIVKTASPDSGVNAGDTITYTFDVTNTGNTTLSNISITEAAFNGTGTPAPDPDADTGTIVTDNGALNDSTNTTTGDNVWDSLGPGDTLRATATYTVTQQDMDTLN